MAESWPDRAAIGWGMEGSVMVASETDESRIRAGRSLGLRTRERFAEAAVMAGSTRGLITLALLLAMMVTAVEQTVVSTAMTSIIASLHGLDIFPWVFSAFLLTSTVTTPLYGKLADRLGRKRVLLFGLGMFALGSVLSGLAQSMPQLIAMRVLQGLGAGAVSPVVLTMLGDLFSLEERAKVQGLFSAVWGVSSVAGPALGGVLTDRLSWRWVFFVTVPFALVSMWILATKVNEPARPADARNAGPVDWWGAVLLSAGSAGLMLAVLRAGAQSTQVGVMTLAASAGLLVMFVRHEQKAADPLLPIDLLLTPNIAASVCLSVMIGGLLFCIDTYVPLFMQGVLGSSATLAGRTITPLLLSWSISVAVAAKVVVPLGFRRTAQVGSLLIAAGSIGLVFGAAHPAHANLIFMASLGVIGLGMGPTSLSCILDVQNSVARDRRGTATGVVIFSRTMGGALGVGLLGASLGIGLASRLGSAQGIDPTAALRPESHALLTPEQLRAVQQALGASLRDVFLQMAGMAGMAFVCSFGLRGGRAVSHKDAGTSHHEQPAPEPFDLAAVEH